MRLAIAVALLVATPARGNPVDAFSFGGRAPAMGGAQTADARDGSAGFVNPALLAWFDRIHLEVGYQAAHPRLTLDGRDLEVDDVRGLTLAVSSPGRLGPVELGIGVGLFLPDTQLTRIRYLPTGQPRFVLYDNRPQRLVLAVNGAARIGDRLAVGVGIGYLADTSGGVALDGRLGYPDAEASELGLAVDVDLPPISYPQAGVAWKANDWLTCGAMFRGGFDHVADLSIALDGTIGAEGLEPIVEDAHLFVESLVSDRFQPAQFSVGLAAAPTAAITLTLDAAYARWSTFDNPATRIDIELDAGEFNDLFELPDTSALERPGFRDIVIVRVGGEHVARGARVDLATRAGYAYEPSPAPEQRGRENFADSDKHLVSAGGGVTLHHLGEVMPGPLSIDAFVAVTALESRRHRKRSPVDPIGDYTSAGHILSAGLATSWQF